MKRLFYLMTLCVACVCMVGCSDDDDDRSSSKIDIAPSDTTTFVLRFEDYLDAGDVAIESADSTQIFVSARYADDMKFDFQPRNLIVVWRAINEIPFVRRITNVERGQDGYRLTTEYADFGDVFVNGNFKFDTSEYVNLGEAEMTNGHFNSNRYYDSNNRTYHPVVYIMPDDSTFEENAKSLRRDSGQGRFVDDCADGVTRNAGEHAVRYRAVTAEEVMQRTRGLAGAKFNFIDIHPVIRNRVLPIDDVGGCNIRLNTLEFRLYGGLEINAEIDWFKLSKFEAYLNAGAGAGIDMDVTLGITGPHEFKDRELGKFPAYTSVFAVGPIPVAITFSSKLVFKHSVVGSMGIQFPLKADASASFKIGPKYDKGKWSLYKKGEADAKATPLQLRANADFSYIAGLYASADVKLYGCAGPKFLAGPKLVTKVKVYASSSEKDPGAFETSGQLVFGGFLGAEISIWKWKIAGCSFEYNLMEKELWKYRYPEK